MSSAPPFFTRYGISRTREPDAPLKIEPYEAVCHRGGLRPTVLAAAVGVPVVAPPVVIALVIVAVAVAAAAAATVGWRRRSRVYAEAAPPAAAPAPVAPVPIQLVPTGAVTRSVLITRQDSAGNNVVQEQAVTADSTGPAVLLPQGAISRRS